jgi:UDP-N-acetyl-D-glucosamine dehydrogenase
LHLKEIQIEKFSNKTAIIGIIGLGYVGLPLCVQYIVQGYSVIGFDVDPEKISALNKGNRYIQHIDIAPIKGAVVSNMFLPTTDFSQINRVDAIIICVPTPLDEHREPDLSFVHNSIDAILPHLKQGQVLSLESTTYPGTTEEEIRPKLQQAGFDIGKDFFLVYSPEREDPNNPDYSTRTIPKICGGSTPECLEVGLALYGHIIDQLVKVSSTSAAEMTKILENTFRAVNIALVNELKIVADKMGMDIFEVIDAAATKPFGFMPFYPGPGLGGHCIPIDPFYLTWKSKEYDVTTRFIELAGEINTAMPNYVLSKIVDALNTQSKAINGATILILGLAYKKNVDDVRESPSVVLIEKLIEKGGRVSYSDPHVPRFPAMRKHILDLKSIPLTSETLHTFDCVVVATNHDRFDWILIREHSNIIVDTRGQYLADNKRIFRA